MNVRQCLHKFCAQCIEDYNRKYKKECPACRTPIGSRRQLRKDNTLHSIISSLIGNLDQTHKFNQLEDKLRKKRIKDDKDVYLNQMQEIFNK